MRFIRESEGRPFFAMLCPPAAHDPTVPAPQHANEFADVKAPRTANFGNVSADKHWFVRATGRRFTSADERYDDLLQRRRMLTLLSVDDMVGDLVTLLGDLGLENNTYIFYTSDHGYHLGQFGILKDKRLPYETDLRVPGYVRGPTIRPGSKLDSPVLNIDFAPSFLELAGVKSEFNFDGESFASQVLFGPSPMTERSPTVRMWQGVPSETSFVARLVFSRRTIRLGIHLEGI